MFRTVYSHAMSAPEEIYNALQWMWLNIKFVISQEFEISPHFLYPMHCMCLFDNVGLPFYFSS